MKRIDYRQSKVMFLYIRKNRQILVFTKENLQKKEFQKIIYGPKLYLHQFYYFFFCVKQNDNDHYKNQ